MICHFVFPNHHLTNPKDKGNLPPGGSEEKYKNIFNNILWDQHYISRPPSSRKFGAAGVDVGSHIETNDNRVNLSLTFPLFQKHTDLMSDIGLFNLDPEITYYFVSKAASSEFISKVV